jgi:putative membrane protein
MSSVVTRARYQQRKGAQKIISDISFANWIDKPPVFVPILPVIEPPDAHGDPRIYMAAERTFLAWLRTGIALMGLGFVVARFGLFLREIAASQTSIKLPHAGFSLPAGILLIALGIMVNVVASIRHHRCVRAIDRGQFREKFGTAFGLWLAGLLALIGLVVAIYLAAL